jgi:hypothetical protein
MKAANKVECGIIHETSPYLMPIIVVKQREDHIVDVHVFVDERLNNCLKDPLLVI